MSQLSSASVGREPSNLMRAAAAAFAVLTIVAGVLDALSTELALATGHAYEANPVVRGLQELGGLFWIVPKMAAHGLLAYVLVRYPNIWTIGLLGGLALATLAVALNNFQIYFDIIATLNAEAA